MQHCVAQRPADQLDAAQPRRVAGGILRAGHEGQHGHQRDQALQGRHGRRVPLSRLCQHRRPDQDRHPHGRISGAGEGIGLARG